MARITTGDTDFLREYYYTRHGLNDVLDYLGGDNLLGRHWYSDEMNNIERWDRTVIDPITQEQNNDVAVTLEYASGALIHIFGSNLQLENPEQWVINELHFYVAAGLGEGFTLESGNILFDTNYKIAPGSEADIVTINDPIGGPQILDPEAMPNSAGLIGNLRVETNDNPYLSVTYTEKFAAWDDGYKLRILGLTEDSNVFNAPEMTQQLDTVISESNGVEVFRIDDFGFVYSTFTDEILDAGPDAFIEHFLSGDDHISGTSDDDFLYAGAGDDLVEAGDGNDTLIGGSGLGNDRYSGGEGIDRIEYQSATNGIEVNLAQGYAKSISVDAEIGKDTLDQIEAIIGSDFDDKLIGDSKANYFKGRSGDDEIIGGAGIDTARYDEARSTVTKNGSYWTVFGDQLSGIERIEFSDSHLALDLDGSAGLTVKTLAAVIGEAGLSNKEYVGIGLELFDAGQSLADVCELALGAVGATTNEEVVNLLYTNLYGEAPTTEQAQPFVDLLDDGVFTKGSLAAAAAELTDDLGVIDLVGLAETGIEYV